MKRDVSNCAVQERIYAHYMVVSRLTLDHKNTHNFPDVADRLHHWTDLESVPGARKLLRFERPRRSDEGPEPVGLA